jgi:hypothetical protein
MPAKAKTEPGRRELADELLAIVMSPRGDPGNKLAELYSRLMDELNPAAHQPAVEGSEAA